MKNSLENEVRSFLSRRKEVTTQELTEYIHLYNPSYTPGTISTYLTRMVNNGVIFRNGRGSYTLDEKLSYAPPVTRRIKLLANMIRREFPLLGFCVWDSGWLNEFMRHQLFRHMLVIEVEKDGAESVFFSMSDANKKAFLSPDANVFQHYVTQYDDPVIIVPLMSQAPLIESGKVPIPALEKFLVDMVANQNLYASQQAELNFIYQTAIGKYRISYPKIKRYARRRNQLKKVLTLIQQAEEDLQKQIKR